jgi:hypothetical protein
MKDSQPNLRSKTKREWREQCLRTFKRMMMAVDKTPEASKVGNQRQFTSKQKTFRKTILSSNRQVASSNSPRNTPSNPPCGDRTLY